ncbi:MAG: hypothetical protein FJW26_00335 [Acidimicrobiia bacterium]|nr:hypothetical protein [Acidimicrobiia bacterium]
MKKPTREEIIQQLKLEKSILEDGGYGHSVRTPLKDEIYFRDSISCPNYGEPVRVHPCSECFLIEFVHPAYLDVNLPCHFIPLNPAGDTIDSLVRSGDTDKLESCLLAWLESTVKNLEAAQASAPERSEPSGER